MVDPQVPHPSNEFLAQRIMLKNSDSSQWLEAGWVEAGWVGSQQYVYTYNSGDNAWHFYPQYPISPNQRIYIEITTNGVVGAGEKYTYAYIWWNGQWNLLDQYYRPASANSPITDRAENYVEINSQDDGLRFTFPSIQIGDGSLSGVQVIRQSTLAWERWDNTIPSTWGTGPRPYSTNYARQFFDGSVTAYNTLPTSSLSVSPSSGTRATTFSATASGSDADGDPITYSINWGDGATTNGSSGTHRYSAPGSFGVTAKACDQTGCTTSSAQTVQVANNPPVAQLSVTPSQGDLTTTFSASMSGSSDPDGDALTYQIDWGDGAVTQSSSGSHKYSSPGDYGVAGTATDAYGASSRAFQTVHICAALAGGVCAPAPPTDGDLCTLSPSTCAASDAADGAYSSVADGASCESVPDNGSTCDALANSSVVGDTAGDPGGIAPVGGPQTFLVLSANLEQAFSDPPNAKENCDDLKPGDPDYKKQKACGEKQREKTFAQRVKTLSLKQTGADGLHGEPPDIILLQEVRHADLIRPDGTGGILKHLNNQFPALDWKIAKDFDYPDAIAETNTQTQTAHVTQAETAILYASSTLVERNADASLNQRYIETRYSHNSEGCSSPTFVDVDLDGLNDCSTAYWKRNAVASFRRKGTSASVAVASVHLVPPEFLSGNINRESIYAGWASELASDLANKDYFPPRDVGAYVIGGDWNAQRCESGTKETVGCVPHQQWWDTLLGSFSYIDSVFRVHGHDQSELDNQYKDGNSTREHRIDSIWGNGFSQVARASHDLTCGLPANCNRLSNPERYSDHRLVWSLFQEGS